MVPFLIYSCTSSYTNHQVQQGSHFSPYFNDKSHIMFRCVFLLKRGKQPIQGGYSLPIRLRSFLSLLKHFLGHQINMNNSSKNNEIKYFTAFLESFFPRSMQDLAGTEIRLNGTTMGCMFLYWFSTTARENFHSISALV